MQDYPRYRSRYRASDRLDPDAPASASSTICAPARPKPGCSSPPAWFSAPSSADENRLHADYPRKTEGIQTTMGIFSRLTDIINSNLNSILDRAEDPEKLIRLVIQEMEDTLVEVRSSTVRTIAERKEIERKLSQLGREMEEWQRKAELALSRDRDDLAKGALVAKSKIAEQIDVLQHQLVHIEEALAKSSEDIGRLQEKLTDAKKREKAIVLRHKSAASRLKVNTQIHDDRINDAFARFEQVERNLDELEGRAESLDIGRRKTLAEEFSDFEASTKVEQELADLKARMHNSKPMAG